MRNIANKLSLSAFAMMALSACTFSSDALFPSLFGSDTQEEYAAESKSSVETDLPQLGTTDFQPLEIAQVSNTGTFVGQKVVSFRGDLTQLQSSIRKHNEELQKIRASVINNALQYHKVIGMIEAKLQVGTTPGNPQMYTMLQSAQNNIQVMNGNTIALNQLAQRVASDAAMTTFLSDSIKATYGVSGAVDEDHRQLRVLENEANQTSILINSLLLEINNDITRQQQYIETARNYIVDLSTAIKSGSFMGAPLPVSGTAMPALGKSYAAPRNVSGKPLFVAKFNRQDVKYQDGLKQAVNRALAAKPGVFFEVVAVTPANGSALSGSTARNNASNVFQEMVDLGVSPDKIALSARTSEEATVSEVHVYVR